MTTEKLQRALNLPLTFFYGLGTILGAGIYVLVGKVAGIAGMLSPLSFLAAFILAAFSALSYAELGSRFPMSAGAALYVEKGIGIRFLSLISGLLIVASGLVSSGTLILGFIGYLQEFFVINIPLVKIIIILILGFFTWLGIKESVGIASLITLIEISGLLLIIWTGRHVLIDSSNQWHMLIPQLNDWKFIFLGSFVAFYAFIGFEDMANIAEEVVNPKRNLPLAILFVLVASSVLYLLVSLVSVFSVPINQLSQHDAPLALVFETNANIKPVVVTIIGLFAVINGALIQIIMASRLLFGMSDLGWLPRFFSIVDAKRKTPVFSILIIVGVLILLTLIFPLLTLAKLTSFFTLFVFILVNFSLVRVKIKEGKPEGIFTVPIFVPITGGLVSAFFLIFQFVSS